MTTSKWIGVALLVVAGVGVALFAPRAWRSRRERLDYLQAGSAALAKSEGLLSGGNVVDEAHREEFEHAMTDAKTFSDQARDNADSENQALRYLAVIVLIGAAGLFLVFRHMRPEARAQR